MFNTMTSLKLASGFLAGFLFFLLANWAGKELYHSGASHSKHDADHAQGYKIDTGTDSETAAAEVVQVAFADVYAAADADAGARLWRQCSACHVLEPEVHRTGPSLHGVVGKATGAADGYAYSSALAAIEGVWTPEELSKFLENPKAYAAGTKMSYRGMSDIEDRANLIAYIATFE